MIKKRIISITGLFFVSTLLSFTLPFLTNSTPTASAADAANFKPGRIIDDYVFYNNNSMSTSQVQSFLNARMQNCDTNGTGAATEWGRPDLTRATLASYIRNGTNGYTRDTGFHAPPYTCLKDYTQDTPQMESASGLCGGISAKSNQTSSQIVKAIANACGISPQVLLVLLQKEQSLVTDNWPLDRQYESATGFACPDTAPCDPAYDGFFYQVYYAARQFKIYQAYPNNYNYRAGQTNSIYWHPDLSRCGSSNVYIENQATAALYIYTPYRPNQAALNNLYGTGDSCSSYGNRNFWRLFTDWFGNPLGVKYEKMDLPRYMQLNESQRKTSLLTLDDIGSTLSENQIIFFDEKTTISGSTYLRSSYDSTNKLDRGILLSDLSEIDIAFEAIDTPRYLEATEDLYKINPKTQRAIGAVIRKGQDVLFSEAFSINGVEYLRSSFDSNQDWLRTVPAEKLAEIEVTEMEIPRFMEVARDTNKRSLLTLSASGDALSEGDVTYFDSKMTINDTTYLRTAEDTTSNLSLGVSMDDLNEISVSFEPMWTPRYMRITEDLYKVSPKTGEEIGAILSAGQDILLSDSFMLDGVQYLRSEYDSQRGWARAIPRTLLEEVPVVDMEVPRDMRTTRELRKSSFNTLGEIGSTLPKDKEMRFETKTIINGTTYLRTSFDTANGLQRGINISDLRNI